MICSGLQRMKIPMGTGTKNKEVCMHTYHKGGLYMEKYTVDHIRKCLHYIIDRISDKALLYSVWVRLERSYIR